MICIICDNNINNDDYVKTAEKFLHLCCFIKQITQQIGNNEFAFNITGKQLTAKEMFLKTVTVKCKH